MLGAHVVLKKIGGTKFLLLELFVTTFGLLIALSLNNFVESRHHRDMVRQADAAMRGEIESNARVVESIKQQIIMANTGLDKDLVELADLRAHPDRPHVTLHLNFIVISFDDTAWKTSQTAGAFVYMPYESASEFSSIYSTQQDVYEVQQQTIADMLIAASDYATKGKDENLSPAEIEKTVDRIGTAKMRLMYLKNLVGGLAITYRQYQAKHP